MQLRPRRRTLRRQGLPRSPLITLAPVRGGVAVPVKAARGSASALVHASVLVAVGLVAVDLDQELVLNLSEGLDVIELTKRVLDRPQSLLGFALLHVARDSGPVQRLGLRGLARRG